MDFSQNITQSPTFCPAPWTSLNIDQVGRVMPCMTSNFLIGNIKQKSITEIITDVPIESMKKSQLLGQWHTGCSECQNRERYGQSPRTQWRIEKSLLNDIEQDIRNFYYLEHLTVNWSNLCNLACTYCNVETSTAWQAIKGVPISHVKNEHLSLIDLVTTKGQGLKGLSLGGGEPLLQKGLPDLLNKINHNQVNVLVTTNLSVDLASNSVYQCLKHWPNVDWMISFDTANESQFEYVRHNASWKMFCHNIQIMKSDNQNVIAHPAYSVYCALDLQSLYQFCFDQQLNLFWCDLSHPVALDVRRQNAQLRAKAVDEIDAVTQYWNGKIAMGSFDTLARYRQQLVDPSYLLPVNQADCDLKAFCRRIEKQLQKTQTFEQLWSHVYQWL